MGAGQSIPLDTATEELKERVGLFSLRGTQKQFLEGLSVFLKLVLSQNTLYDLEPLLTDPEKCHELFVVLSSVLKKEFRVLRLPDATTRGATHKVPWMTKKQYEQLETEPLRKGVCNDIAWFVLRYTTLIVALTASVKINQEMPALLERAALVAGTVTKNKAFKDPVMTPQLQTTISFTPAISQETLNGLMMGTLRHVKLAGVDTPDMRPLYSFDGQDRIILNAQHGFIYAPQRSSTAVLSIELTPVQIQGQLPAQRPMIAQYAQAPVQMQRSDATQFAPIAVPQAYQPPAVPQAAAVVPQAAAVPVARPQFIRNNASTNGFTIGRQTATTKNEASVLGGQRKTRRGRKMRRVTRKSQRGGEGDQWYMVRLRNLVNCASAPCPEMDVFYLNNKGSTVNKESFGQIGTGAFVDSKPFADRVEKIFSNDSVPKVATETPTETGASTTEGFLPLNKIDASTYKNLMAVQKALETKAEGTSPAQYRAFLLATRLEKQAAGQPDVLHNLFCADSWATRRTTDMASYALLNALYSDRQDGGKESATADELRKTIGDFTGAKVLQDYVSAGSFVETFENTKFPGIPAELDPYCKQVRSDPAFRNSGNRGVVGLDDKEILLGAHKALRDLYDKHLQDVIDILKKIVMPKKTGYGQAPELLLAPEFESDERGALVLLEDYIKDARQKLAAHYIAVEKVYYGALQNLRERAQGRYVSPTGPKV